MTTAPSDLSPERWDRVEALFNEALECDPAERAAFLDRVCEGDPDLRRQVDRLLEADAAAGSFLADAAAGLAGAIGKLAGSFGDRPDDLAPPPFEEPEGRTVGAYRIVNELGRGGMGVVYRAHDTRLDRPVALKFLSPLLSTNEEARARFLAEARAASALDHPNICTIFEIGETDTHLAFIAMACYQGSSLRDRIARGPLPVDDALSIAVQTARGLAQAHAHGIVHRDVKPANLLITESGTVKILDFGIAKSAACTDLTRSGTMLGTAAYMSPEQARSRPIDGRTDIWSLGVVLYEALTGTRPFEGSTMTALLYAILEHEPALPTERRAEIPHDLECIVLRMLTKDPADRYARIEDVLADLEAVQDGRPIAVVPQPPRPPARRRVRPRVGAAVAVVLLALAALWVGLQGTGAPPPGAQTEPSARAAVAVFPFAVNSDRDVSYLRQGLATLLSTKLDGVADLRSIDPNALLGYIASMQDQMVDPTFAREAAARFGARYFILGTMVMVTDQIKLNAALYDAAGREQARAQAMVTGESNILQGLDDLARDLVITRLQAPSEQLASLAAMTTPSYDALQAYLEGEEAIRRGAFMQAVDALQRSVAADSTFALAWYRLARAAGWTGPPELNMTALQRALAHDEDLPERARLLIRSYYAHRAGRPDEAERFARQILVSYPDDVETLLLLGEALYHYNPYRGRPTAEARAPLARALVYAPDDREVMIHLMDLAAREGRRDALDSLTGRFLAVPPGPGETHAVHQAYQALRDLTLYPEQQEAVFQRLQEAGPEAVRTTLVRIAPQFDDLAAAERLAVLLAAPTGTEADRIFGALHQSLFAVAQGRWSRADAPLAGIAEIDPGTALLFRVLVHTAPFAPTPSDTLTALREAVAGRRIWEKDGFYAGVEDAVGAYLQGLLSWRLDDAEALTHARQRIEAGAPEPGTPAYAFARTLDALDAFDGHQYDRVLTLLDEAGLAMPFYERGRSPLYEQTLNRYLRAEALRALGRDRDALNWYASLYDGYRHWGALYLGPSHLRRAEIYDALNEPDSARVHYQRLQTLWQYGDPAVRARLDPSAGTTGR